MNLRPLIKQKKGDLSDTIIFVITVFVLGIGFFIINFIVPQITGGLRTAGLNATSEGAAAINQTESQLTGVINYGTFFLFVGLIMSIMITSFFARQHPVFLFLYIIFLGIAIILSAYLGNTYDTLKNNPIFANYLNQSNLISIFMNYILEITLAVGALSMIIVFSKFSTFGGTQQY